MKKVALTFLYGDFVVIHVTCNSTKQMLLVLRYIRTLQILPTTMVGISRTHLSLGRAKFVRI